MQTITTFDNTAEGWERSLYAFLAEKERRSGSRRTVEGYSRMLQHFFASVGKPPDQVTSAEVFAWGYGVGLSGKQPSSVTIGARVLVSEDLYWMSYKLLERRFYHLGVSASQARVLAVLHYSGEPIKPSAVATLLFQETPEHHRHHQPHRVAGLGPPAARSKRSACRRAGADGRRAQVDRRDRADLPAIL
jgi:hypothetical protein